MNPPMNALARLPMQGGNLNALAPQNVRAGGDMQGQMPPMQQGGPAPPQQGMPTQEMLDAEWARNPSDMTGEAIEQIVQRSGGALVVPWARQQSMPPMMAPHR